MTVPLPDLGAVGDGADECPYGPDCCDRWADRAARVEAWRDWQVSEGGNGAWRRGWHSTEDTVREWCDLNAVHPNPPGGAWTTERVWMRPYRHGLTRRMECREGDVAAERWTRLDWAES